MPNLYSDTDAPWDFLAKHLAGEASASEQQELHAWITATPDRLPLLTAAIRAWERGGTAAEEFTEADLEPAWQRFQVAADMAPAAPISATIPAGRVVPLWPAARPWLRIAAAVLLLIGVWSLLRIFLLNNRQEEMVTVTAAAAQRQQTTLPDGSQVWVNRYSTLEREDTYYRSQSRAAAICQKARNETTVLS